MMEVDEDTVLRPYVMKGFVPTWPTGVQKDHTTDSWPLYIMNFQKQLNFPRENSMFFLLLLSLPSVW